jgi:hypothetical protein
VLHGVLVRAGNILMSLEFLQYEEFLAYLLVKAGSLYYLLKNIKAETGRNEVFISQAHILGR